MSVFPTNIVDQIVLFDATGVSVTITDALDAPLYIEEFQTSVRGDGSERVDARTSVIQIFTADGNALAQLRNWQNANTLVRAFIVGRDRVLRWLEPVVPRVFELQSESMVALRSVVRLFTALRTPNIISWRENLILDNVWALDGATISAGVFSISAEENATSFVRKTILYPFPNSTLTAEIDVTANALDLQNGDIALLSVTYINASNTVISTQSVNLPSTGIYSLSLTLPANTYSLLYSVEASVAPLEPLKVISFRTPSLRRGTTGTYVAY